MMRRNLLAGALATAMLIPRPGHALLGIDDAIGGVLDSLVSALTDITALLNLAGEYEFLGDAAAFGAEVQFYLDLAKDAEGFVSDISSTRRTFESLYRGWDKLKNADEGTIRRLHRLRILLERAQRTAETQSEVLRTQAGSAVFQQALANVQRTPVVLNPLGQQVVANEWARLQAKQNDLLIGQLTNMASQMAADRAERAADELDQNALRERFFDGLPDEARELGPQEICVTIGGERICR